jgi:hypothetical protein
MLFVLLAALVAVLLLAGYAQEWGRVRRRPVLGLASETHQAAPLVSILIPARNEERNIERCVAGALAQRYPAFELLVLDDHSTDGTATLLAGFSDTRLRVLAGEALPPGWTGKCFACQQLGAAARGEWLLFLDADTAPAPELVAAMVAHAERRDLALLTLLPLLELKTFWERAVLPPFVGLITATFPFDRLERADARPDEVLAIGQCMLVRRSAYEAISGHSAVRNAVLEDVRLAQTLRAAGFRVGVGDGRALLRVRMYRSGREVLAGLTKNAAAGYSSGGGRAFGEATRLLALAFGPLWLVAAGVWLLAGGLGATGLAVLGWGALALAGALLLWGNVYRSLYGLRSWNAALWPLGLLAYLLIALRGIWLVRTGQGVVWKGRRYVG